MVLDLVFLSLFSRTCNDVIAVFTRYCCWSANYLTDDILPPSRLSVRLSADDLSS